MTSRGRAVLWSGVLVALGVVLVVVFPKALGFVEMAAREIRYLWWIILLGALAVWLIWGVGRRPKP
jgi:hypothetical protein